MLRSRSRRIFSILNLSIKCSIRKLAQKAGVSKSAADCHKKAIEKRNLFPESYFWETQQGYAWLCRLFLNLGNISYLILLHIPVEGHGYKTLHNFDDYSYSLCYNHNNEGPTYRNSMID